MTVPCIDVNIVCGYGNTALHYACYEGHENIIKTLLSVPSINAFAVDYARETPLQCTDDRSIKLLLREFIQSKGFFTPYLVQYRPDGNTVITLQNHTQPITISRDDSQCPICQEEYTNNNQLIFLPCKHHFHKACIDEWIIVNDNCPVCRGPFIQELANYRQS